MKQTYSVNIGGRPYNVDSDAYELLDRYLGEISSRLSSSDVDTMGDIESRIADILDERVTSSMQVVTVEMVRRAMAVIGRPETFGDPKRNFSHRSGSNHRDGDDSTGRDCGWDSRDYSAEPKRLFRSLRHRVLGGVCGGLAEYFDLDPSLVRVIAVILFIIPPFPALLAYIIMWIVVPQAPVYVK